MSLLYIIDKNIAMNKVEQKPNLYLQNVRQSCDPFRQFRVATHRQSLTKGYHNSVELQRCNSNIPVNSFDICKCLKENLW